MHFFSERATFPEICAPRMSHVGACEQRSRFWGLKQVGGVIFRTRAPWTFPKIRSHKYGVSCFANIVFITFMVTQCFLCFQFNSLCFHCFLVIFIVILCYPLLCAVSVLWFPFVRHCFFIVHQFYSVFFVCFYFVLPRCWLIFIASPHF